MCYNCVDVEDIKMETLKERATLFVVSVLEIITLEMVYSVAVGNERKDIRKLSTVYIVRNVP